MNKLAKPEADDFGDLSDLHGPPPTEVETEAWIARNRDAINASLREARQELAEGKAEPWDFEAMLADAEAAFDKSQRADARAKGCSIHASAE